MLTGESIFRVLIFISMIPVIGAAVVYFRGNRSGSIKWNVTLPIIAIIGTLLAMLSQPLGQEGLNAPALSLLAIPIAEVLLCAVTFRFPASYHFLFWVVWLVNVAIIGMGIYLAFFFKIF